jgi:putative transcriptional regulator
MIRYHTENEMLLDYASGSLAEEPALVVAAHLAFCDLCRSEVRSIENLGGSLMTDCGSEVMSSDALDQAMSRLDAGPDSIEEAQAMPVDPVLPGPVARYLGTGLDELKWRRVGLRVKEAVIPTTNSEFRTSLLRIQPGTAIPIHTHGGHEYTLVLKGGILDDDRQYRRGDLMCEEEHNEHRPRAAEDDECICLVVLDAPVRFTGFFGRLLNPSA